MQSLEKKKERLNQLDGKTWERYSISVWDITKTPKETRLRHPAMFPIELCKRLIQIYTKKGDTVLDPFMGSGSAIVASEDLERKGIGIDVNPNFVKLAKSRLSQQKLLTSNIVESEIYCADATNLLDYVKPTSVDLVITSPPYWMIHKRKRSADYKESRPYSALESDLGNIENYDQFKGALEEIFEKVHYALKPLKRCIVIVMDIRIQNRFIPFHLDIVHMMEKIGFVLEDIIVWDRRREYSNLRPLGFPYVFVVNKVHEYIMIFRKNKEEQIEIEENARLP